jgi:hypothetical protein
MVLLIQESLFITHVKLSCELASAGVKAAKDIWKLIDCGKHCQSKSSIWKWMAESTFIH